MTVTLVSGFLGSGKTSLLKHVLLNRQGIRCAVICNEISDINIDVIALSGAQVLKADDALIELSSGCICCNLRDDLWKQVRDLAAQGEYDCVLIESSGIADPLQTAETFFMPMGKNPPLQRIAPLDTCITVVDATTLKGYFTNGRGRPQSTKMLPRTRGEKRSRAPPQNTGDGVCVDASSSQNVSKLLFDQLEFANVIVLNKTDQLNGGKQEIQELIALVQSVNDQAKIVPAVHSQVDLSLVVRTGLFTEEYAKGLDKWLEDLKNGVPPVPETVEYSISSTIFKAKQPFHPQRLYDWIVQHFKLNELDLTGVEEDEEDEDEEDSAKVKRTSSQNRQRTSGVKGMKTVRDQAAARQTAYGSIFRSKGFVWVGSPHRLNHFASWSQAGDVLTFGVGGVWEQFPHYRSDDLPEEPGQQLVFLGQHLKTDVLLADLSKLLLTDEEMAQLLAQAAKDPLVDVFPDPFKPFPFEVVEEEEECEEEDQAKKPTSQSKAPAKQGVRKRK